MITAAELAGFFAAHAIWTVSEGDSPIPMLAYTTEDDERKMERLVHDDFAAAVEFGREKLESNEMDANDAVLVFDGRISIDGQQFDAVIIEMRAYLAPDSKAVIAVPYTPATAGQFRVHTPKLLAWDGCEDFDPEDALEAFFMGVDEHEKGAAIWKNSLDDSI